MLFAQMKSFYITVLFIIAICFIYILIFYTMIPLIKNAIIKNKLLNHFKENNIEYKINKKTSNEYDYSIEVNNTEYYIKVIDIKKNSDIQISTNKTLVVFYKTITNAFKTKEILEVKEFIESKKKNKIILLNSKVNKIALSKNEHEVIELNETDKFNNTMIISDKNFNSIIKK